MSMLAEPRRKQKWALNPRGKQWSEDSSKFGQKMLEKMGWTNGKGLGANEQGMTEHVRVSLKNDMGGIGFKNEDLDKAWTEQQESFNDFLQKLQQDSNSNVVQIEEGKSELSGKSLELKSKQSRARVHYQKFTRGKDVNKYSPKDLANIFGQKELNINKDDKNQNDSLENCDPVGSKVNRGGVITINGGNMTDYFMRKSRALPVKLKNKEQQGDDSQSEPEYAGFGFASFNNSKSIDKEPQDACTYAFDNPCVQSNSPENNPSLNNESKSSKKRKSDDNEFGSSTKAKKFKQNIITENHCRNGFVNPALNLDSQTEEACNGQEFEVSRVPFGLTNTALDLSDETEDKKRVRFNDRVEYNTDVLKKKKGKSMLDKFEVENKKAKKKKHNESEKHCASSPVSSGFVNEALDVEETPEEVCDNEINERKSKKSKKRKGSRRSNLETIVEMPDEDKEICDEEPENKRVKKEDGTAENFSHKEDASCKKKKKKKQKEKVEEIEPDEDVIVSEINISEKEQCEIDKSEENISKKTKKKKKKSKNAEADSEKEENTKDGNAEAIEEEEKVCVAKKKKKKKKELKFKEENNIDDINSTEMNTNDEKEVSDKENANNTQGSETKVNKKEYKKPVDESVNDISVLSTESTEESVKESRIIQNNTPTRSATNARFNNTSSPWNHRARMSKKLLKSLFQRNSIQNFPGSNIHEIQGYGADTH